MLHFICAYKSTYVRTLNIFNFTSWLDDVSISFTEAELLADLHRKLKYSLGKSAKSADKELAL